MQISIASSQIICMVYIPMPERGFLSKLCSRQLAVMADNGNKSSGSNKKSHSSQHCCVPLCTSDSRYDPSLHFHQIPFDPEAKKQWIIKIRRNEGPLFKVGHLFLFLKNQ